MRSRLVALVKVTIVEVCYLVSYCTQVSMARIPEMNYCRFLSCREHSISSSSWTVSSRSRSLRLRFLMRVVWIPMRYGWSFYRVNGNVHLG